MVNLIEKNYDTNICTFFADTVDDLEKLPNMTTNGTDELSNIPICGMGSKCFLKNGAIYRLNGNNAYELF